MSLPGHGSKTDEALCCLNSSFPGQRNLLAFLHKLLALPALCSARLPQLSGILVSASDQMGSGATVGGPMSQFLCLSRKVRDDSKKLSIFQQALCLGRAGSYSQLWLLINSLCLCVAELSVPCTDFPPGAISSACSPLGIKHC